MSVLVVEDEPKVATLVSKSLEDAGYGVVVAASGEEAVGNISAGEPDLIVLDLMLPDCFALDLLPTFKARTDAPILILTARNGVQERVRGLDLGADDYLGKPFRIAELVARVNALMRRSSKPSALVVTGHLTIDLSGRKVHVGGRKVFLSPTEFAVLEVLANHIGMPVSRQRLLEQIWDDHARQTNVVEVYVNYVRHKLERTGHPQLIKTIRGAGYQLERRPPV